MKYVMNDVMKSYLIRNDLKFKIRRREFVMTILEHKHNLEHKNYLSNLLPILWQTMTPLSKNKQYQQSF